MHRDNAEIIAGREPPSSERRENEETASERCRIVAEYSRRAREIDNGRYAPWQPSAAFLRATNRRIAADMLHKAGVFPHVASLCLEVGFGSLGWLGDLITWGVREVNIHGVELDARRANIVQDQLPNADLRIGDATNLPWPDGRFHLVIASTMFTSILDSRVRQKAAEEIQRVLAPGGALLWYDFARNNPANPQVRRVSRREIRELFPALRGRIQSITLAPPLARAATPISWVMATVLESIPFLRTHLIAVLVKRQDV